MQELKCYIYELDPDFVMITESWASDLIDDVVLKLQGYNIMRKDRQRKKGGGCILYCKSYLTAVMDSELTNFNDTEAVWCNLTTDNGNILMGVFYHSPSANSEQELDLHNMISMACDRQGEKIICRDFNHSSIDWGSLHSGAEGVKFVNLVQDCFLVQHVDQPTRGNNILDLVLSSNEALVENLLVNEPFGTSDHNAITFDLVTSVQIKVWTISYFDKLSAPVTRTTVSSPVV